MKTREDGVGFQNVFPATQLTRCQQRTLDSLRVSEDVIGVVERQETREQPTTLVVVAALIQTWSGMITNNKPWRIWELATGIV